MRANPKGAKYRNLTARSDVTYYQRVIAGKDASNGVVSNLLRNDSAGRADSASEALGSAARLGAVAGLHAIRKLHRSDAHNRTEPPLPARAAPLKSPSAGGLSPLVGFGLVGHAAGRRHRLR